MTTFIKTDSSNITSSGVRLTVSLILFPVSLPLLLVSPETLSVSLIQFLVSFIVSANKYSVVIVTKPLERLNAYRIFHAVLYHYCGFSLFTTKFSKNTRQIQKLKSYKLILRTLNVVLNG